MLFFRPHLPKQSLKPPIPTHSKNARRSLAPLNTITFSTKSLTLPRKNRTHYYNSTDQGLITGNPNTWTEAPTVKSIYDPCPYGYRVPPISSFEGFPTTCDPWTSGDITGGWVTNNAWWGPGGWRLSGGTTQVADVVFLASATAWSAARGLFIHGSRAGEITTSANFPRHFCVSVRCLPE